jgi:hypothetical protein
LSTPWKQADRESAASGAHRSGRRSATNATMIQSEDVGRTWARHGAGETRLRACRPSVRVTYRSCSLTMAGRQALEALGDPTAGHLRTARHEAAPVRELADALPVSRPRCRSISRCSNSRGWS